MCVCVCVCVSYCFFNAFPALRAQHLASYEHFINGGQSILHECLYSCLTAVCVCVFKSPPLLPLWPPYYSISVLLFVFAYWRDPWPSSPTHIQNDVFVIHKDRKPCGFFRVPVWRHRLERTVPQDQDVGTGAHLDSQLFVPFISAWVSNNVGAAAAPRFERFERCRTERRRETLWEKRGWKDHLNPELLILSDLLMSK